MRNRETKKTTVQNETAKDSRPTPKRFDPRTTDIADAVHSPRPHEAAVPAWLYDERQSNKAAKIVAWHERGLGYTVADLCRMLGVKPAFVVEVYDFYQLYPYPAAGESEPMAAGRRNAHSIWVNPPKSADPFPPKSKGGPSY